MNSRRTWLTFISIWLPLMLLLAVILWLLYRTQAASALTIAREREWQSIRLARQVITTELQSLGNDALYLANLPALQDFLAQDTPATRQRFGAELLNFLQHRPAYDHLRFIDLQGLEQARVNREGSAVIPVPKQALQDKSERYYVQEALPLKQGELYATPFDLNVEFGEIVQPIKPTLRIATPVFDRQGQKRGLIALNYLGQRLLERIRAIAAEGAGQIWLLNAEGYWLLGPSPELEWGFMYPQRRDTSFAKHHSAAWSIINEGPKHSQFRLKNNLFTYSRIAPETALGNPGIPTAIGPNDWLVMTRLPTDILSNQTQDYAKNMGIIFAVMIILLAAISWLSAHHLARRRWAEHELRSSETRFRTLLELAPDAIVIVDQQGCINLVNARAEQWFGYTREELIGRAIEVLIPRHLRNHHKDYRNEYIARPIVRPMGTGLELYGLRKDGSEFPVEVSLSPIYTEAGTLITSIIRDASARKQAEQQVRQLNQALSQRAQALESINHELEAFSYSVSHDLRAPLRAIDGFSRILLNEYGAQLDDGGREYLQRVCAAAQKMGALIDDLLKLSRVTRAELKREPVDLSRLADDVIRDFQKGDPTRQAQVRIQPGLQTTGDSRLLRIVLDNLLGNAWKFTAKRDIAKIEFGSTSSDGVDTYFVHDNGAGFDMTYVDKLFGAFQRLHASSEFPGTGIGLATVQRIISKHGGRVWAESSVDQGTSFYFTLQTQMESR